ncbi:hypothetical protein GJ744_004810 [Endocarpon pusillum]|uniref:DUF6594 domain-containing protein n=1 Tax=Endocarpon pusillum TaxID=364733 RepID=A0A8H7A7Q7_9EURO|nr:hypothetical protein GJ744_004810 [Endocarpon pusillum]
MERLRSHLPFWNPSESTVATERQIKKIEDYKSGYPRFTALVSAHDQFFLCRRFDKLRARLLLLKQDRLSILEQRLDQVDQQETSLLFLGKSRCDGNTNRISLLSEIESCLTDYDQFVERANRMLGFGPAQQRNIESLQNWLDGTGCLAREETAYLTHHRELVSLAPAGDTAVSQVETWVEDKFIQFFRSFRTSSFHDVSTDPNVYLYSGPLIKRTAQALLLFLITLLLLIPVVICNILTKSRTIELILAGATYTTVLIVFVSGTSGIGS